METKSNQNNGVIQIVDAKTMLTEYIILGFTAVVTPIVGILTMFNGSFLGGLAVVLFGGAITYIYYLSLQSFKDGYIIDIPNDSFTFPGGRAADQVEDYFNKDWILQRLGFQRAEIQLSTITHISREDRREQKWSKQSQKYITYNYHEISIEGTFGTITKNLNKGKRDQLYSMFQQTLNMGQPININK